MKLKSIILIFFLLVIASNISSCIVKPETITEALNLKSSHIQNIETTALSNPGNMTTNQTITLSFIVEGDSNMNAKYDLNLCKHLSCDVISADGLGDNFKNLGPFPAGLNSIKINIYDYNRGGITKIYQNTDYRGMLTVTDPDGEHGSKTLLFEDIKTKSDPTEFIFINKFGHDLFSADWDLRDVMLYLDKGGEDAGSNQFDLKIEILPEVSEIPLETQILNNIDLNFLGNIATNHPTLPVASFSANSGFFFLKGITVNARAGQIIRLRVTARNNNTDKTYQTAISPPFRVAHSTSKESIIRTEMRSVMFKKTWNLPSYSANAEGENLRLVVQNGHAWFNGYDTVTLKYQKIIDEIGAGDLILYDTNSTLKRTNALLVVTGYNKFTKKYTVTSLVKGKNPRNVLVEAGTKHFVVSRAFTSLYHLFNTTSVPGAVAADNSHVVDYLLYYTTYGYHGEIPNPLKRIYPQGWQKSDLKTDLVGEKIDFKVFCYGNNSAKEIVPSTIKIENFITSRNNRIHILTPQGKKYSKKSFRHKGKISNDPADNFYVFQTSEFSDHIRIKVPNVIIEGIYFESFGNSTAYSIAALDSSGSQGLNNIHIRSNLFHSHAYNGTSINYIQLHGGANYFIYFNQFANTYTGSTAPSQQAVRSETSGNTSIDHPIMKLFMFNNTTIGLSHNLQLIDNNVQEHDLYYYNNFSYMNEDFNSFDFILQDSYSSTVGEYFSDSNFYRSKEMTVDDGITNSVNGLFTNFNSVEMSGQGDNYLNIRFNDYYNDDFTRNPNELLLAPGEGSVNVFNGNFAPSNFETNTGSGEVYDIKGTKVNFNLLPIGSSY